VTTTTEGRGRLAIVLAAMLWSTAGIGQRSLDVDAATQTSGRALFAFVTLAVLVQLLHPGGLVAAARSLGRWDVVFAVLMAVASGTFVFALNVTSVANVLFMQAAAPMLAALLGWALLHDRVPGRTWLAIGIAGAGVAVMVGESLGGGAAATLLPFAMSAAFAGTVVIARHRREVSMLPATCLSQALVLAVVAPFASPGEASSSDWAILAALGVAQMGLSLALFTLGARLIPPAEVALLSLLEVVLGPLWVWLVYEEQPAGTTIVGGAIVLIAVVVQATGPGLPGRARWPAPGP
jgi:drug/metabolite transporter (DMT)-like permease